MNLQRHLKSAAITFASSMVVDVYSAMQGSSNFGDVAWKVVLSAAAFSAVRAVLKLVVEKGLTSDTK